MESEPEFVEKIGCTYVFFWETDAACPVSNQNFESEVGKNCQIRHPKSGHVYNLSHLKLPKNLETKDGKGNKIFVNLCAPIIKDGEFNGSRIGFIESLFVTLIQDLFLNNLGFN